MPAPGGKKNKTVESNQPMEDRNTLVLFGNMIIFSNGRKYMVFMLVPNGSRKYTLRNFKETFCSLLEIII